MRSGARCSWCGRDVEPDDGFRLHEPVGARRAEFCRLEHVVAWAIRGAHWEAAESGAAAAADAAVSECAWCEGPLDDRRMVLIRHRGEHRIPDAFCRLDHLLDWAKAGGRWAT